MVTVKEAQSRIQSFSRNYGQEAIQLKNSLGRILSEDIVADRDYPPFNRSAMDGYAVIAEGFTKDSIFKVIGEVHAGSYFNGEIQLAECVRIMTGAPVPLGMDAVIKVEDSTEIDNQVRFKVDAVRPWQNISRCGEDACSGDLIIHKSQIIGQSEISTLAVLGKEEIRVYSQPRVAIISTGNEIKPLGNNVLPHQIRDSNSYSIEAFFNRFNIPISLKKIVPDEIGALTEALKEVLEYDIVITSGGVSMGDADFVPQVLADLGSNEVFHKVQIKPGKPIWFGHAGGCVIFGLPGNPVSVQVSCKVFIEPYLRRCFGLADQLILKLPILHSKRKSAKFDEFFPCKIETTTYSALVPIHFNGSGDISATLDSHGLALHPSEKGDLSVGDILDFLHW